MRTKVQIADWVYQAAPLCPGIPPVLTDLFPGQARVARRLIVSGLHINGVKVDPSHSLAHINGITFCTKCGNYAVKIVRELAKGWQDEGFQSYQGKKPEKTTPGQAPSRNDLA